MKEKRKKADLTMDKGTLLTLELEAEEKQKGEGDSAAQPQAIS